MIFLATTVEYIEFVCEQLHVSAPVRYRKMFGEYMVYVNEKPLLLVCDNTVFVKKLPEIAEYMQAASCGVPYNGAKEHYILDIENAELSRKVIDRLEAVTPLPKPRKKKGTP